MFLRGEKWYDRVGQLEYYLKSGIACGDTDTNKFFLSQSEEEEKGFRSSKDIFIHRQLYLFTAKL